MLRRSFILLERIGEQSERNIWEQGISTWDEFRGNSIKGFSGIRKNYYDKKIEEAEKALRKEEAAYFRQKLPFAHQWRLWNDFKDDAVFLDIETSGYYGDITVLGLYDGYNTKTMVRGFNLSKELLEKEMKKYKLLVTFNGASFDLPVIKRYFGLNFDIPHIDLRFVCSKIGLNGGLKAIEKKTGIKRAEEVSDISGEDAVYLWQRWKTTGKRKFLDLLVQYNEEDIVNLKPLADLSIKKLWGKTYDHSITSKSCGRE